MDAALAQVKHSNYVDLRRVAACQEGDPETGAKEVFLEGVEVTRKWSTSSAPV